MLSRKKTLLMIAISVLLVLMLSSCEMVFHNKFNADGSGTFSISFAATKEDFSVFLEEYGGGYLDIDEDEVIEYLMETSGYGSIDELCAGLGSEIDFGGEPTVEGSEKNGGLECNISYDFKDLDEFRAIMDADDLIVTIEGDTFTFKSVGDDTGVADLGQFMYFEEYGIDVSILFKVTAPGTIKETNGTKSGNTVTWDMLEIAKEGGDMSMTLISSTSGGGGMDTTTIIIIAVVVVVVILFLSQQKKSEEEV